MDFDDLKLCRLCMNTSFLEDLYISEGETNLNTIIYFCFNIVVQQGDGLPSVICKDCLKKIKMFNNFKQVCLNVDWKFKNMKGTSNNNLATKMQEIVKDKPNIGYEYHRTVELNLSETFKAHDYNIKGTPHTTLDINLQLSDKTNSNLRNKIINNLNNSYQCEQCGRVFKMKTVLEKHISTHSGIKPFLCKLCPKRFTRAENRTIHMRSHLGIKPYVCEICGSSSTKRQDLIRHMKIHSDERKYSCSVCHRNFKRSSDVISHKRTHTGLRPYKCNMCGKSYTSHSGLRKHNNTQCKK